MNLKARYFSVTIVSLVTVLLMVTQNCAQPSFMISEGGQLDLSSSQANVDNPHFNLMSSNQIHQTFLSLTGQDIDSNVVRDEFNRRRTSFSDQGEVKAINSPYLLSLTSLAGVSCNSILVKERALAENAKRFYKGINLNGMSALISDKAFLDSANEFSQTFWRENLSESETSELLDFKKQFLGDVQDSVAQTGHLLNGLCSVMLANIRVVSL